ncbi:MAG: prolyl oligopeptidase family serine peptidase [Bryobacteraceae bacterium]
MCRVPLLLLALAIGGFAQKPPFDVNAMMKLARISEPQISPDGRTVAFTVTTIDVANNKRLSQIWVVPVAGGTPRQITRDGEDNNRPRWSPDSRSIAYISNRGGSAQVWLMDAEGGNARQVTNISTEAGGVLFSPDGKNLVFTSEVFPECGADDACNRKKLDEEKAGKVRARTYTALLYRHWNRWEGARRSHLLVVPVAGGTAKDLTPGTREAPPFSLGGPDDYAISPDGQELCYAINGDAMPATSTNSDLFVVALAGGQPRRITSNPGADNSPLYSPDGKWLAWRSQRRAGYESDRWRLIVMERATGRLNVLTEGVDRWVASFTWAPDSSRLFFTTEDRGQQAIWYIAVTGGEIKQAASGASQLDDMQFTPDGRTMVYTGQSGSQPVEIYRATSGGAAEPLTRLNEAVLNGYQLTPLEDFWVEGAEGAQVQAFLVKPPGFREDRKYPVLVLIHGGPQGAWGQSWSYRWNPQVFAAAGYVVVMPNPRGSTGYGQKFIDEINNDWGGRAFDDIMAVTDRVTTLPYVDSSRMAAAGGSYGGYMANWILGHTARFKALVSHAGVYDLKSMFGETEELWFPLWEFGGTPWSNPDAYARWSPSTYVNEFRTPTLVVHGELDFRVPFGQGLQLFTALQMQKVPSKLLIYPDEGHWVNKPQNSVLWYKTFLDWTNTWTRK